MNTPTNDESRMPTTTTAEVIADALDMATPPESDFSWDSLRHHFEQFFTYLRGLEDTKLAIEATAIIGLVAHLAAELHRYRAADQIVHDVRRITIDWHPEVEPLAAYLDARTPGEGQKLRDLFEALGAHRVG